MIPRASVSAVRINEVLETQVIINDPAAPKTEQEYKKGLLEFINVSFTYPDAKENVLSNVTFTASKGETTAIIGSTGSGKSSLVNLIPRFFDVTEGEILVDGINVKDYTQHDLHGKIGYVPQKGVLFSGTIDSNIRYGNVEASKEEVEKAATIAQAIEFINEKPEKFDAEIAQGGSNVSGGQKQRLSIARAIAKNPAIYIFDDSFSALDYKTDVVLRKALKSETKNAITLIVAQRISTILHADRIIVLDEGKVAGIGTHKELLNKCEVYMQIAMSQLSKEELANE
jgi:ATP-binding cassette subfamily B multidrug efflux pump